VSRRITFRSWDLTQGRLPQLEGHKLVSNATPGA